MANTPIYTPNQITFDPNSTAQLAQWMQNELQLLSRGLSNIPKLQFGVQNVPSPQPRTGTLVYADGTNWNPGFGEGLYEYTSAGLWLPAFAHRNALLATTFYVATTGSDSNDGRTISTPWRHIQHAVDYVCTSVDTQNKLVQIQLANGTYAESVTLRPYVGTFLATQESSPASATEMRIVGDTTTPGNVIIDGGGSLSAFFASDCTTPWFLTGMTVKGGIFCDYTALVNIGTIVFSTNAVSAHITARYGSRVELIAGSTITVSANASAFASTIAGAIILGQGGAAAITGVMSGTPAFSDAFAKINDQTCLVDLSSMSWSGSATGAKAYINGGSNGQADPTTYPGSSNPIYDTLFMGKVVTPVANGGTGDTGTAWASYTPSITSQGGSITTSSATGRFKTIGKTTFFEVDISISNAGTGTGYLGVSLPLTTANANYSACGFQVNTGALVAAFMGSGGSTTIAHVTRYDAASIISSGSEIVISGVYEAA